jgi:hypothetical protein
MHVTIMFDLLILSCAAVLYYIHTCGPLEPAQQQQQKYIGLYSTFLDEEKHSESSSLGWW